MKAYTGSQSSKEFKDAYFSDEEDVKWCMDVLRGLYDLKEKTALEPAAGSRVFPKEAPELVWTTNELYPEFSQGENHDFNVEFTKGDRSCFGRYDFVITNPPYGVGSHEAKKFVKNSLEHSDVVAMILPRPMRRGTYLDKQLPRDCRIVFDENLPKSTFNLPDGSTKKVGTLFLVLEREEGYYRENILEYEPEGYELQAVDFRPKRGDVKEKWFREGMTHALCLWGNSGRTCSRENPDKPYVNGVQMKLTPEQAEVVYAIDWSEQIARTKGTFAHLSWPEVVTEINKALRGV